MPLLSSLPPLCAAFSRSREDKNYTFFLFIAYTRVWPTGHRSEQRPGGGIVGYAMVEQLCCRSRVNHPWRRNVAVVEAAAQRLPGQCQAARCSRWSAEMGKLGEGARRKRRREWGANKDRVKKQEGNGGKKGGKSAKRKTTVYCVADVSPHVRMLTG